MNVQPVTLPDLTSWFDLAREVESLFGPMVGQPEFEAAVKRAIDDGRAFCIRQDDGVPGTALLGAILISTRQNSIGWLAVARRHRGKGLGSALLAHALDRLDRSREIAVETFAAEVPEGAAARALYRRFGFVAAGRSGESPAPVPTERFIRPAETIPPDKGEDRG